MRKSRDVLAAVTIFIAVSLGSHEVAASPVAYQFTVIGVSGPLTGVTSIGSFVFDQSIAPEGGGFVNVAGLFTHLEFSWDGVNYNESSANTGSLGFEADGSLIYALFGTNCGPSGFGCGVGNDPQPHQWSFNIYYGNGTFYYLSPEDPSNIYVGAVSLTPILSPTDKRQCMHGGWKEYQGPNGPFKNQGDCIQYVNTGK